MKAMIISGELAHEAKFETLPLPGDEIVINDHTGDHQYNVIKLKHVIYEGVATVWIMVEPPPTPTPRDYLNALRSG
jgi:hypothetical protein